MLVSSLEKVNNPRRERSPAGTALPAAGRSAGLGADRELDPREKILGRHRLGVVEVDLPTKLMSDPTETPPSQPRGLHGPHSSVPISRELPHSDSVDSVEINRSSV